LITDCLETNYKLENVDKEIKIIKEVSNGKYKLKNIISEQKPSQNGPIVWMVGDTVTEHEDK
jgi:hypothetical protein